MRRFNVVVSDEAGLFLDIFKRDCGFTSLDTALDKLLILNYAKWEKKEDAPATTSA